MTNGQQAHNFLQISGNLNSFYKIHMPAIKKGNLLLKVSLFFGNSVISYL
jgi:hypothetical protein